jgi:hypothetical protein
MHCTAGTANTICKLPPDSFSCQPPPSPAPSPPLPPSPPSPPLPPSCAPKANATFFCEANDCYSWSQQPAAFPAAAQACAAAGGSLVYYIDPDTQQRVEKYFTRTRPAILLYWMGIRRAALTATYRMMDPDGTPAAKLADGSELYAHWAWDQGRAAATSGADCVVAWSK